MPERRSLPAINIKPREMPFDQIVQVRGRNPIGEALPAFGKVIGDAMVQREQLRKLAQQTAAIETATGAQPGAYAGMEPDQAIQMAKLLHEKQQVKGTRYIAAGNGLMFDSQTGEYTTPPNFGQLTSNDLNKQKNLEMRGLQLAGNLRNQFLQQSKPFSEISQAYNRVQTAAQKKSAAGDLSMLYNYMKILDPTSVVRESEFAQAAASGSYGERMKANVNLIFTGERLSDDIRNDFLFQAGQLYQGQEKLHKQREDEFSRVATNEGIDPRNVVINVRNITQNEQPTPEQPGESPQQRKARLLQELAGAR